MRGDRSVPRGEAGRVALRVRELLGEDDVAADDFDDVDDEAAPTRWQQLRARVPVRLDPGRRATWGVAAAVVLAAIVTGLWLVSSRPAPVPVAARVPQVPGSAVLGSADATRSASGSRSVPSGPAGVAPSPAAGSTGSAASGVVVVDVAGKVRSPGLYRLPAGSRIDDAVKAAGGARPGVDLSSLNLAAPLADGQQILVGVPGAGVQGPGAGGTGGAAAGPAGSGVPSTGGSGPSGAPVNLNTATLEQLDTLPGVGPVLAQHILDWRGQHGQFGSVDQLNDVSGIGDVKFAELKALVTV